MSEDRAPAVTAEALAWLDARPEPAPPELRQRMAEGRSPRLPDLRALRA